MLLKDVDELVGMEYPAESDDDVSEEDHSLLRPASEEHWQPLADSEKQ